MKTLREWGGVARTSRDPPQVPHCGAGWAAALLGSRHRDRQGPSISRCGTRIAWQAQALRRRLARRVTHSIMPSPSR